MNFYQKLSYSHTKHPKQKRKCPITQHVCEKKVENAVSVNMLMGWGTLALVT